MPALTAEPWAGLAKVQLVTSATGVGRYWTVSVTDVNPVTASGDQASWDFSGDAVAVTLRAEWGMDPGSVIGAPDTINVTVRIPTGLAVGSTWSFAPVGDTGSATRTLHFDTDPLDQALGAAATRRYGMLELHLQVIDDPGGTTSDYTLDSRGTAAIGPPALTTYSWARGYIRQAATASAIAASNVSLGGAEPASWAHPDSIFIRGTTSASPFENVGATSSTVRIRRPQGQGGAVEREDSTAGGALSGTAWDISLTDNGGTPLNNKVGSGMFVGSEAKDVDMEFTATGATFDGIQKFVWASTQPAGFSRIDERTLRYVGRMANVDPRINFTGYHLLQLDDPAYGTPPMSKNVSPAQRTDTEFGFVSTRARNVRSEGLNGLVWATKMWDANEFSGSEVAPVVDHSATSATMGGEAGWANELTVWSETRPGGLWQKKVVITSPANAVGLEQDNTATTTLIAHDSRIVLHVAAGDPATPGTHWTPGRQLTIGTRLFREFSPVSVDTGTGLCAVLRFNATTGRLQHLASVSPAMWTDIANDTPVTTFPMSASPGDADIYLKTFAGADTADFDTSDLFILAQLKREGASYQGFDTLDALGSFWRHDQAAAIASIAESSILFDGTGGHDHTGGTTGRAIGDRS
jgi:hypothetical protein